MSHTEGVTMSRVESNRSSYLCLLGKTCRTRSSGSLYYNDSVQSWARCTRVATHMPFCVFQGALFSTQRWCTESRPSTLVLGRGYIFVPRGGFQYEVRMCCQILRGDFVFAAHADSFRIFPAMSLLWAQAPYMAICTG